ncbi:MAG: hypothetical protein RLZZ546_2880, partial [Bacteroidota bacterium]
MKKTIILIFNLLWSLYLTSQSCIPTSIVFSNQAQVDAFPSQYPGCQHILGNVGITGTVQNLDSLNQIQSIGGSLSILNVNNLNSIDGLSNLDSIGGSLLVKNTSINSFIPFQNISHVGQNIKFEINYNDPIYPTFQYIEKINGDIFLQGFNNNISVSIFPNLDSLNNLSITSFKLGLGSFASLLKVKNTLYLGSCSILPSFNNLVTVDGVLNLSFNSFYTISGFQNLAMVGSYLYIGS